MKHVSRLTTPVVLLLFLQSALMWAAFFVLSSSTGWPASLDLPAAEKLTLFTDHETALRTGYMLYAGSALLLVPLAVLLRAALVGKGVLGDLAVAFGVAAGLVKVATLTRWLFLAPAMAAAGPEPAVRTAAVMAFDAADAIGSGLGEAVGIGVLSAAWTACVAAALLRAGSRLSRPLGYAGLGAAALLTLSIPAAFGVALGPVLTVSGIAWQAWLLGLAGWIVRTKWVRRTQDSRPATGLPRPVQVACLGAVLVLTIPATTSEAQAQPTARTTFAEVGIGFAKSEFYGRLEEGDEMRDAQGFSPNVGGTLSFAFYQRAGWASPRLYLGGRFKVQVATPTSGDGPEEYFFNHYYGGVSARYYPFQRERAGLYAQLDLTYGQFTEKLRNTTADRADHQFAVGPGVLGAIGYAIPVGGARRLGLQFYVQRNTGQGDVDGEGEVTFGYGALGAEVVLGF